MQCSVPDCERPSFGKGFCTMHYQRHKRGIAVGGAERLIATTEQHNAALNDALSAGDACVIWPFGKDTFGYGCVTHNGKKDRTNRTQWERANGQTVPKGMVVRHTCDNPSCINPNHLIIGTQAENIADQAARGRKAVGAMKGGAKLTDEIVRSVRQRKNNGETLRDMALEFGVSEGTLSQAYRRDTWRHVS